MYSISSLILILGMLFFGCEQNDPVTLTISSGSSFGECGGYCLRDLVITEESLTYTATGHDPSTYPPRVLDGVLDPTEWELLLANLDLQALESYADIIGCPDCADGGAEYIRVDFSDGFKQVTFEYGDTLSNIQPLIDQMRDLRDTFEAELFSRLAAE